MDLSFKGVFAKSSIREAGRLDGLLDRRNFGRLVLSWLLYYSFRNGIHSQALPVERKQM